MFIRKKYVLIALAESMKRVGDHRNMCFERSLSGMTLELAKILDSEGLNCHRALIDMRKIL